jgi:3-hydroxybutyryl-CoA dehydratase
MQVGDALPAVQQQVAQSQIDKYAEASGDFNPIHVDRDFAAGSQFGGTIAHGMLVAASISEMMTAAFKEHWLEGGRLKIRFKAPVRPGDTVTAFGQVKSLRERSGGTQVSCSVGVRNQDGDSAITGEATVTVPSTG